MGGLTAGTSAASNTRTSARIPTTLAASARRSSRSGAAGVHAPAAGRADRDLAEQLHGSGEEKVGDVGAGNEDRNATAPSSNLNTSRVWLPVNRSLKLWRITMPASGWWWGHMAEALSDCGRLGPCRRQREVARGAEHREVADLALVRVGRPGDGRPQAARARETSRRAASRRQSSAGVSLTPDGR